jgi:hypothetical protein
MAHEDVLEWYAVELLLLLQSCLHERERECGWMDAWIGVMCHPCILSLSFGITFFKANV